MTALPKITPMQSIEVDQPFHRAGWTYEEKYDGWRMIAYKDGRHVQLISRAFGCVPGDFMAAYTGNRKAATALALEACPIVPPLRDLLMGAGLWSGTATELLTTLNATTVEETRRLKAWPKSPNAVAGILRRLAPSLRGMEGLEVSFDRGGHAGTRRIVLTLKEAER